MFWLTTLVSSTSTLLMMTTATATATTALLVCVSAAATVSYRRPVQKKKREKKTIRPECAVEGIRTIWLCSVQKCKKKSTGVQIFNNWVDSLTQNVLVYRCMCGLIGTGGGDYSDCRCRNAKTFVAQKCIWIPCLCYWLPLCGCLPAWLAS